MRTWTRRGLAVGLGATALVGICGAYRAPGTDLAGGRPPQNPAPTTVRLSDTLTLHLVQTGWVSVKQAHRAFGGPDALAVAAIIASGSWTQWLPVTATVIEHPDGVVVVDTGETARIAEPDYTACDGAAGWFYSNNLRFAVAPRGEIGPQLRTLDIDTASVGTVVMTHLHSDHMGGMGWFPNARFLVSAVDAGGHAGALLCRVPDAATRIPITYEGRARDAFPAHHAVTTDGVVSIVPTSGHTRGHQSVLLREGNRSWLIAGDAVFDTEQIATGAIAGIAEDRGAARATVAMLHRQIDEFGTIVIPTHDAGSALRLVSL